MTDLIAQIFEQDDEFFPGSKQRRRESPAQRQERVTEERRAAKEAESWDAHPVLRHFRGQDDMEFFHIGALAKALGKEPVTIRTWIRKGWLPKAKYSTPGVEGTFNNAGRRLWTRAQIEGILRIAQEEELLNDWHPDVDGSRFTERVRAEWRSWG